MAATWMSKQQQHQHQRPPGVPIMGWPEGLDPAPYGMRPGDGMGTGTSSQTLRATTNNGNSNNISADSSPYVRATAATGSSSTPNAFEDQAQRSLDIFSSKRAGSFVDQQQQSHPSDVSGAGGVGISVVEEHPSSIVTSFASSTAPGGDGSVLEPAWSTPPYGIADPGPSVSGFPLRGIRPQAGNHHQIGAGPSQPSEEKDAQRLHEMKEYFKRPPRTSHHTGFFAHHHQQLQNPHAQQQHGQAFFENSAFRTSRQHDTTSENGSREGAVQQDGAPGGVLGDNGSGNGSGGIVERLLWTSGGATVTPGVLADEPASNQSGDDDAEVVNEFDPQADCRPGGGVSGVSSHHSGQQSGVAGSGGGGGGGGSPTSSFWRDVGEPVNVNASFPWDLQLPNPAPPLAHPHVSSLGLRGGGGPQEPSRPPQRGGNGGLSDHTSSGAFDMVNGVRGGPASVGGASHGVGGFSDNSSVYGGAMRWGSGASQSAADTCFSWGLPNAGGGGSGDNGYSLVSRHVDEGRRGGQVGIQLETGLPPPPPPPGSGPSCGLGMMMAGTNLGTSGADRFTSSELHNSLTSISMPYKVETGCTQRAAAAAFGLSSDSCGSGGTGGSRVKRARDGNRGGGAAAYPSGIMDRSQGSKRQPHLLGGAGGLSSAGGHQSGGGSDAGSQPPAKSQRKTPASSRRCRQEECQSHPNFGVEGDRRALYCAKHKLKGMINVKAPRCQDPQCTRNPVYGHPGDPRATFCLSHKTPEMVDVKNRCCQHDGCKHQPSFGMVGDRRANFCFAHKLPSHVNIRRARKRLN